MGEAYGGSLRGEADVGEVDVREADVGEAYVREADVREVDVREAYVPGFFLRFGCIAAKRTAHAVSTNKHATAPM